MPMVGIVTEAARGGAEASTPDGSAGPKGPLPEELPSLQLVQPTPDAVALPDLEGVLKTLLPNRTAGAQRLCLGLPPLLLIALLEVVGGEEERGILTATGGVELPAPHPVDSHGVGRDGPSLLRGPSLTVFVSGRSGDSPCSTGGGSSPDPGSGSTRSTRPSTPRTRTRVPGGIGPSLLRPRHSVPFT